MVLATAVAGAIGFVPVVLVATPAFAANTLTATASATEGTNASVSLTLHSDTATSYTITTAPEPSVGVGGAVAGQDYTAPTSPVVFGAPGDQTITIPITDDALYEGTEAFKVTATPGDASGTVNSVITITDNDTAPSYTLTASPNPVTEAAGAKTTVTARLSAVSGMSTTINLTTANGTALSGSDYTALSSQPVVIPAGQLTGVQDILITNDTTKDQADTEVFSVNGSGTNVSPTAASTTVSINDAQSTPKLTLSGGGSVAEGSPATFTVTADTASELPITVQWSSVDPTLASGHGTATPGDDFGYPGTRVVTLSPGQTTTTFSVSLTADGVDEPDEDYAIQLSNPTNAVLGATTKAAGTITDGDTAPTMSITPAAVAEGDSGRKYQSFTATLSAKSGKTVKANWATGETAPGVGSAVAGKDFVSNTGTLTFAPGTTTQTFAVEIIGDTIDEGPGNRTSSTAGGETFNVTTSGVAGEVSPTLTGYGNTAITITDDDAAPSWTFDDSSVKEGNDDHVVLLPIKLTGSSDQSINLTVANAGTGTAKATIGTTLGDHDYALLNTAVAIAPETSMGYAAVLVFGDKMRESDETVNLTATPNATTGGAAWLATAALDAATLTLTNDDDAPDLEINSVGGKEGETVNVTGTVTGSSDTNTLLTVTFAGGSIKGSKAADEKDFTNPGAKVVTIPAGTVSGAIVPVASLPLLEDKTAEPAETIVGSGVGLGNVGTVTDGVVTIAASEGSTPNEPGEAPKPTIMAMGRTGSGPVTITGKVAKDATVELWGAPIGGGELEWIANAKAGPMGNYSFTRTISEGMRFMTQSQKVNSDEVKVMVTVGVTLTASSPSKGRVAVTVKSAPNAAGRKVVVQRWTGPNTWTNILVSKANVNGAYAATTTVPSGAVALRAWVEGDADSGIVTGWSPIVRPTIK
ncbi:Calx-beta domain-containing protein [Actinoplanes sp. NPDC048796]|uniref:beta strand repeat-containing protein n=1 Tax=unclassified Actinoplanes TaxID=2626549 RepID=UPI0033D64E60